MNQVTQLLDAIIGGHAPAMQELLPIVYKELRALAAAQMARQSPGHTLNPTALVHEAYLKLVSTTSTPTWECRAHFFGAAAEAMRQVLVDSARRKKQTRRGGAHVRVELCDDLLACTDQRDEDILGVDQVIDRLAEEDAVVAQLVKLHTYVGLTLEQAAETLGISARTGYRKWAYARAWMFEQLGGLDK